MPSTRRAANHFHSKVVGVCRKIELGQTVVGLLQVVKGTHVIDFQSVQDLAQPSSYSRTRKRISDS